MGLGMADGCGTAGPPHRKAVLRVSCQTQGQGHETTFAQIVAEEIGIPPADIRSSTATPNRPRSASAPTAAAHSVSGAAARSSPARCGTRRMLIASGMLEVSPADLEWNKGRSRSRVSPLARHHPGHRPAGARRRRPARGIEGALAAQDLLRPREPHLPVRRVHLRGRRRPGHRPVKVRRFVAVDDCGTRINKMIIEGQVHRGLTDGVGIAAPGDHLVRRGRQLPQRVADGLPDPGALGPRLGERHDRHAVAASPDRAPRAWVSRPPSTHRRRSWYCRRRSSSPAASATSTPATHPSESRGGRRCGERGASLLMSVTALVLAAEARPPPSPAQATAAVGDGTLLDALSTVRRCGLGQVVAMLSAGTRTVLEAIDLGGCATSAQRQKRRAGCSSSISAALPVMRAVGEGSCCSSATSRWCGRRPVSALVTQARTRAAKCSY